MTAKPSSVPSIKPTVIEGKKPMRPTSVLGGHAFMWSCCILMFGGFGIILWSTPASQSLYTTILSLSPLLACVAMHLVMHRFMGKSCHENSNHKETNK